MAYTDIDDPTIYFDTTLYTGNGSSQTLTMDNIGLLWMKRRDSSIRHCLFDSVRGGHYTGSGNPPLLVSDSDAAAQGTDIDSAAKGITFGATQTVIGNDAAGYSYNVSGHSMVGWQWSAGTSFSNDASATGIGTIDSSGSVNETAGFSIVSYTGTGSAATIKHGLSTTPNMMIIKNLVTSSKDWQVYSPVNDPTDALALNQSDATGDSDVYWNDTAPTSSVFSVKSGATNTSGAATIGYIFSNRQGYSKFGSYTGNGSADGTFVYLGFKPAYVVVKRTDASESWFQYDNKRNAHTGNERYYVLRPNTNSAENTTYSDNWQMDFLSNGFKLRTTAGHLNSGNLIYMAFAESSFVNSKGVPTTAR